ncbi:hypothetical protein OG444_02025 [Streptomyces sp. NBC_01232]|uniref:hypothetical protein n=1 Tax=unclassified Streptomyces TaxID=2593676 RepID=UPI002E142F21|nr:hypothetical protein OG444_02025 [Streptomyces sp. NBC_01232]
MTGTTGRDAPGARPQGIEAAWWLTLAAVAAHVVDWALGAFVIDPTGLDELTAVSGPGAAGRLALSGGILAVLLGGWLAVAVKMRAGRGWARTVLGVAGAGGLLFVVNDYSMSGTVPGVGPALAALPALLAAAAAVPMFLPGVRAHFRARPRGV